jgi:hypothetical protein
MTGVWCCNLFRTSFVALGHICPAEECLCRISLKEVGLRWAEYRFALQILPRYELGYLWLYARQGMCRL